jgi:hypothetical protein
LRRLLSGPWMTGQMKPRPPNQRHPRIPPELGESTSDTYDTYLKQHNT